MRILSWLAGILFTIGVCTTVLVFVVCDPLAEPWSVPASALVASPDAGPAQAPASRGARAGGGLPRVTRSEWLLLLGATGLLGLLATGLSRRSSGAVAKRERAPKRPASPPSAAPVRQSPGREVLAEFEASWRTFATYLQDLVTQKVVPQDASSGEDVQAVRLQVENVARASRSSGATWPPRPPGCRSSPTGLPHDRLLRSPRGSRIRRRDPIRGARSSFASWKAISSTFAFSLARSAGSPRRRGPRRIPPEERGASSPRTSTGSDASGRSGSKRCGRGSRTLDGGTRRSSGSSRGPGRPRTRFSSTSSRPPHVRRPCGTSGRTRSASVE